VTCCLSGLVTWCLMSLCVAGSVGGDSDHPADTRRARPRLLLHSKVFLLLFIILQLRVE